VFVYLQSVLQTYFIYVFVDNLSSYAFPYFYIYFVCFSNIIIFVFIEVDVVLYKIN